MCKMTCIWETQAKDSEIKEKSEVKQGKRQNEAAVNSFTESKRRLGMEQQHLLVCRYCLKGQKRGDAL